MYSAVNPYVRRYMHGVGDYHTDYFTSLPPDGQQSAAAVLDRGKDAALAYASDPAFKSLPFEVKLAIAVELMSAADQDEFRHLLAKTPDEILAYAKNAAVILTKSQPFRLGVSLYSVHLLTQNAKDNPPADNPPADTHPADAAVAIKALLDEADGYAATLKTNGTLGDVAYQQLKDQTKGAGEWTLESATTLRDGVKSMLAMDTHTPPVKTETKTETKVPVWAYLLGGILLINLLKK